MTSLSIDCPRCGHQHELPKGAFHGQDSALCQCASCGHVWRYYNRPLTEYEKQLFTATPKPKPIPQGIHIVQGITNKSGYQKAIHNYYLDWWLLVIVIVLTLIALIREVGQIPSLTWFASEIQTRVTQLYASITESDDVNYDDIIRSTILSTDLNTHNGQPSLTIKAQIENTTSHTIKLPPAKVEVYDQQPEGWSLRTSWMYDMQEPQLSPHQTTVVTTTGPATDHKLPGSVALTFTRH